MEPIRYEIDHARRLILVRVTGNLETHHVVAYIRTLIADPDYRPDYSELVDLRAVDRYDVDPAGIDAIVAEDREQAENLRLRRCALVSEKDFVFGMLRMYQALSDDGQTEVAVFRDIADAVVWLGADAALLEAVGG